MDPLGYNLAVDSVRRHVMSARPDAPVQPDSHRPRPPGPGPIRRAAAAGLRRVAERLAPARPAPATSNARLCS